MKSIIKNLTADQIDTLVALAEQCASYQEACAQARDHLGIQLSPSTLCRIYTKYKIADDADTRAAYIHAAGGQTDLMQLTQNQLQLRLLELASRPNPGASDLRALFQIITRLRALVLSERRVVVAERRIALAEKRDHREAQPAPPPQPSPSPLEIQRGVKISLGKSTAEIDAQITGQAAAAGAPPAPDLAADNDMLIALWTKHVLGKDITIGDELIAKEAATAQISSLSKNHAAM